GQRHPQLADDLLHRQPGRWERPGHSSILVARARLQVMTVPLVPRQVLFGNPERVSPRISPDGARLAWIAPDEGVLNVWVNDVGAPLGEAKAVTADRDRGIRSFFWAHDNRHLLYIQDVGGDENWHLFDVDLQTGDMRDL